MKKGSRFAVVLLVAAAAMFATNGYSTHAQFYVLDGFGGVHAGGGAAAVTGTPYFGFDIAKGIVYVPGQFGGDGVVVLDGFGGIHGSTALGAISPVSPYFGFNIARAIAYRNVPARINGASVLGASTLLTSGIYSSVASTTINAPDDGFILLTGTAEMFCASVAVGGAQMDVSVNIDAITALTNYDYALTIPDCTLVTGGAFERRTVAVTHLFSVSAGAHTLHMLARDGGGTLDPRIRNRSIAALFIDQDNGGISAPIVLPSTDPNAYGVVGQ